MQMGVYLAISESAYSNCLQEKDKHLSTVQWFKTQTHGERAAAQRYMKVSQRVHTHCFKIKFNNYCPFLSATLFCAYLFI